MVVFYIPQKLEKLCGDTFSCKNGSVCKAGDGSEVDLQHQHLGLLSSITSDVDGSSYYCECPPGYIGHDCSVEVKECTSHREDLVHSCYFGSDCIVADNEYGLLDKFCDCSRAHTEDGKLVAGLMCQYTSSTMCVDYDKDFVSTTDAYCTNGGTCQSIVGPDEDFPGCVCDNSKWDGKHCEFEEGVLKDDALDLFSYRKAEILYEENLIHGLGLGMTAPSTSDARVESENFNFTMFGLGFGVVAGVGISLLMLLVVRSRVRQDKGQLIPEDDYNCFVYDGLGPPPNVFSASRKKEGELEDDEESIMQFGNEHYVKHQDSVEILDEVTSRILESQFSRTEVGGAHSKEEELEEDFSSPSYYDREDERLDGKGLSRITIKIGEAPLSPTEDEQSLPMRSIMSLDGDDDVLDDNEHSNIMSLDGSYSEDEDDASNYRIISYV